MGKSSISVRRAALSYAVLPGKVSQAPVVAFFSNDKKKIDPEFPPSQPGAEARQHTKEGVQFLSFVRSSCLLEYLHLVHHHEIRINENNLSLLTGPLILPFGVGS